MGACREVSKWITENVLTPVSRFITEAREACQEVKRWFEEQVSQPVESWVSQQERRCKEQSCNWWCLCCNKWLCWIVMVVVRVVVWVIVTVGKWVAYLVCKIVVTVIGIVVELVLKVIHRLVTFFVCLFTDPLQALKTLWDLWNDIVDTVGDVFDLVISLLDDVIGILTDIGDLISDLGRTFCIFGDVFCAIFGYIFGVIGFIVDWVKDIVDWVRDTIEGVRDLITGLLTLNWCQIQNALGALSFLRVITSVTRIPGGLFYTGPREQLAKNKLSSTITAALTNAFGTDLERIERSKTAARVEGAPVGLPVNIDARRMAIRSSDFLRGLHTSGVLNLHAIAGRVSDCQGKFIYSQFDGEVVYTGTNTTVSQSHLDDFINLGPNEVPSFTVYPIKRDLFKRYLEVARDKGFQIGLNFTWDKITDLVVSSSEFVPLNDGVSSTSGSAQTSLLNLMGRTGRGDDLTLVPVISIFGYIETSLHGLATGGVKGVTFRTRFPEIVFRFVPIHEIGHYFGLQHEGHPSAKDIMFTPAAGGVEWGSTIGEYGFGSGEANFTEQDAVDVWSWITTSPQSNQFLP